MLLRIDTTTGVGSAIGQVGLLAVAGLTFRPETNTLLATDAHPIFWDGSRIYKIAPDTSSVTQLVLFTGAPSGVGFHTLESLAYDRYVRKFYGTSFGGLYEIEISTGEGIYISSSGSNPVGGLCAR